MVSYEYDVEKAKALLAEAGYPDGFKTEFYAYRNRDYAEAISSFLNAVGIDTDFKMLQYSALRELRMKSGTPVSFQTWGSYSINDTSAITSQFFKLFLELGPQLLFTLWPDQTQQFPGALASLKTIA